MEFVSSGSSEILRELCRYRSKWGMWISTSSERPDEVAKAAPYLSPDQVIALIFDGAYLFFDTGEECQRHFDMTVGDDGPTALIFDGPDTVFAVTCDPSGEPQTENT